MIKDILAMWGKISLNNASILHYITGSKELWINSINERVNLLLKSNSRVLGFSCKELEKLPKFSSDENLEKYCLQGNMDVLKILPRTPDKPIILNANRKIFILPGHKPLFMIKIPVFIQLSTASKDESIIIEYPTIQLSSAWFGYKFKGALCYSMVSDFAIEINMRKSIGPYVICPLEIENSSKKMLSFDKIYFEVESLRIYMGDNHLWSNPCKIEYLNEDGMGKLTYFDKEPGFDNAEKLICKCRKGIKKTVWKIKRIVQ